MAIRDVFDEHREALEAAVEALVPVLDQALEQLKAAYLAGNKVLILGNGGSAADAQHLATELVCRVRRDRKALAAIALTTDTSALTAIGNDHGFHRIFARQVDALAAPGDLVLAISTSGNSENVLEAVREAKARGCTVIGFTGRSGGKLAPLVDTLVAVPWDNVSRIQEIHEICFHALAEQLENQLIDHGELS